MEAKEILGECFRKRMFSEKSFIAKPAREFKDNKGISGGDAFRGNTRSHPEHEG